jgi:hypothetical protein
MEKYIVFIILAVALYYLHRYCVQSEVEKFLNSKKIIENFGDAVTVDGVDDNNAINTLAKIAKDLQEGGGLKVKGNINVDGVSNLNGVVNIAGAGGLGAPNSNLKMNGQGIIFGGPNNGLQGDSAQISAGLHEGNSLCVVGMGKTAGERKVTMWAEGGLKIHGQTIQDITAAPGVGTSFKTKNGNYRIIGGCGNGCASDNSLEIHKYKPDGSYESNPFNIIGNNTHINGQLCVGGVCVTGEHLKLLKGEKEFTMKHHKGLQHNSDQVIHNRPEGTVIWSHGWAGGLTTSGEAKGYRSTFTLQPY